MLNAAEARNDHQLRLRMLAYPDLFAYDSKYHRSCYGHFISERNVNAAKEKAETMKSQTVYDRCFNKLCSELEKTVFSKEKSVALLSELQSRFVELLEQTGDRDIDAQSYSSWKLKQKLKTKFGHDIVFISQCGKSDSVCCKSVTVGDALKKATELQIHIDEQGECELGDFEQPVDSDSVILHKAAGVIRNAVAGLSFQENEYLPSGHLEIEKCKSFVPKSLLDFVSWCTSQEHFDNASSVSEREGCADGNLLRVLAICHNIIGLFCSINTPIPFGLGIQMHHDFGSKALIEVLHSTGYSVSYDEVRRFVTSVAKDQLSQSEIYLPRGISAFQEQDPNSVVDAAIDNFDANEDTLDGKSSTHSMAVVLYQRNSNPSDAASVPRTVAK